MGDSNSKIADARLDPQIREFVDRETREKAAQERVLAAVNACRKVLNGMSLNEAAIVVKNLVGDLCASNDNFLWKRWLDDTRQWIQTRRSHRVQAPSPLILPPGQG